jgi:hypothetical protein
MWSPFALIWRLPEQRCTEMRAFSTVMERICTETSDYILVHRDEDLMQ